MKTANLVFMLVAGLCASAYPFPVQEGFEGYGDGTTLNALSNQGWGATSDGATIKTVTNVADAVRGTNALFIAAGLTVSNGVPSLAQSNIWVDVYAHVSMGMPADTPGSANVDSNMTVELFLDTNGCPVVWNPASNVWLVCTQDFQQTSVLMFTSQWERLTLCQNYSNKTAALFLNEHLLFSDMRFIDTNRNVYTLFQAEGGSSVTSYLDQVSMTYLPPTNWTVDLDHDGMSEAQELQLYGNTTTRFRPVITVSCAEGGVVTTNDFDSGIVTNGGAFDVMPGGTNTFWLSASNGYYVADATTNGQSVGSFEGQYTSNALCVWKNIVPDGLRNATFGGVFLRKPQITAAALGMGGLSPTGGLVALADREAFPGGQVVCALTADVAYAVSAVRTNGIEAATLSGQPRTALYTVNDIWTDMTVTGIFAYTGLRNVPSDYPTLQDAISGALAGDTIIVGSSVTGNVAISQNLNLIATNVVINGAMTIAAGSTGSLVGCQGLMVTGGVSVANGGVLCVNGGSNNVGTLVIQSGGTVQVVSATAFIANGRTYSGTFSLGDGWDVLLVKQSLPFNDAFETYVIGDRMNHQGHSGWEASSDGVVVQSNHVQSGRAVEVPANAVFSGTMAATSSSNVWVEFYYQDTNRIPVETATMYPVDTNMAVEFFISTNGFVTVFNPTLGAGQWDVCSNDVQGAGVSELDNNAWARITVNQDYTRGKAALFLNGRLLRQELRFINTNLTNSGKFEVDAGYAGPTYVDTYSVRTNWVGITVIDGDHDGWSDAWEIDHYGNTQQSPPVGSVYLVR